MVYPIPIPYTSAKLPRSLTIRGLGNLEIDFTTTTASAIVAALSSAVKIGAIQKLGVEQNIDLHEWRELDADLGGQIVEWVPGKEEITLSMTGIVLYSGDIIDAFGYDVDSLLEMQAPFVVEMSERRNGPNGTGGAVQSRSTYFLGCRFANRPFSADIHEADVIRMDYTAKATRILRTKWQ